MSKDGDTNRGALTNRSLFFKYVFRVNCSLCFATKKVNKITPLAWLLIKCPLAHDAELTTHSVNSNKAGVHAGETNLFSAS